MVCQAAPTSLTSALCIQLLISSILSCRRAESFGVQSSFVATAFSPARIHQDSKTSSPRFPNGRPTWAHFAAESEVGSETVNVLEDIVLALEGRDLDPASQEADVQLEITEITEETDDEESEEEESEEMKNTKKMMQEAIMMAKSSEGSHGPYPRPICGAVLVSKDGRILGKGRSNYERHAVEFALEEAGVDAIPLREWCVALPTDTEFRKDLAESTLYVTLEPSNERQGEEKPPITQLISMSGIPRLVIGCQDPIAAMEGATTLHANGVSTTLGGILQEDCQHLIESYTALCNTPLQRMARSYKKRYGRPTGVLHCSVIDSDDADAFVRNGNSFGTNFGGQHLSYRDFGTYEIAPPPESAWAQLEVGEGKREDEEQFSTEVDNFFVEEIDDEEKQTGLLMPWYGQVDAVVATFPKSGNGPIDDPSIQARLKGLQWLASHGKSLPAGVERILVMDTTDLQDLPLMNDDPNLPPGVDVQSFWKAAGRKPSRILLRNGDNAMAIAVAQAAAQASAAAAQASVLAQQAIEAGNAEEAAELALQCQDAAMKANEFIQQEIQKTQDLKQRLQDLGVKVEILKGSKAIDVMNHLGKRNGYNSVVWRAGCWGNRGVEAILDGAFQRVSAHLAVDAIGGKFWQLILAERALQSACGPERQLKVFAEDDSINLEYCDRVDIDRDCDLTFDGRPVRHVRLDARVAVIDEITASRFETSPGKAKKAKKVSTKKRFHEVSTALT